MTIYHIFHYINDLILLVLCNKAFLNINIIFTVPNLLLIYFVLSNFLDVPKSITFNYDYGSSLIKITFSGFKSLCTIFYS